MVIGNIKSFVVPLGYFLDISCVFFKLISTTSVLSILQACSPFSDSHFHRFRSLQGSRGSDIFVPVPLGVCVTDDNKNMLGECCVHEFTGVVIFHSYHITDNQPPGGWLLVDHFL